MSRPLTAAVLALSATSVVAWAAVAAQASRTAHKPASASAPAAAPVWIVDKAASRLSFRASANGEGFDGVFKTWDAQIAFDAKNLKASHAMVSVTMASVVTGDPTRDQMLPTSDWFDVGKFGKSTFETTSITQTSPDHFVATGSLAMHGVKRPVTLPFTLTFDKDVAKMDGTTTLNRMDFSLGHGQAGGPETVAPQVSVTVKLTAHKAH
jgi:polyisoprenoid-binding protein YceI